MKENFRKQHLFNSESHVLVIQVGQDKEKIKGNATKTWNQLYVNFKLLEIICLVA